MAADVALLSSARIILAGRRLGCGPCLSEFNWWWAELRGRDAPLKRGFLHAAEGFRSALPCFFAAGYHSAPLFPASPFEDCLAA
jgi:hypothetical protein